MKNFTLEAALKRQALKQQKQLKLAETIKKLDMALIKHSGIDDIDLNEPYFFEDIEIMIRLCEIDGNLLSKASIKLKRSIALVIVACRQTPSAFVHAGNFIKSSKCLVQAIVNQYPGTFQFIPEKFRNDEKIAWIAARYDFSLLQYTSEEIQKKLTLLNEPEMGA